jgi:hypothetical protein
MESRFLKPLVSKSLAANPMAPPDKPATSSAALKPLYSAVLYGPPGTAKTTIVTSIAQYLGYNFVTIDTADFLAYGMARILPLCRCKARTPHSRLHISTGLQNIASRMTYIFDRLKLLEDTVILFDEIEEFCLNRGKRQPMPAALGPPTQPAPDFRPSAEEKSLSMESRMLTTAMLTQLNDLRRQQKSVFFIGEMRMLRTHSAEAVL